MKGIKVFNLGSFKVSLNGTDLTGMLRTRKECALLAYLAEEPARPHQRETIAELLWPDRPEKYARMNLRQALLGIRKAFGGEETAITFLSVTENTIQIDRSHIWVDTQAFNEHIQAISNHPHQNLYTCPDCTDHLEQAIQNYRGSFLDDIILGDVTCFQEWLTQQRERHFRQMLTALQMLSKTCFKRTDYDQAYLYARRYIDLAPLEESAHRLLMRILYLTGRRNAALEQYQVCRAIIQRELGVEPSAATIQLYKYIKQELPIEKIETGSLPTNGGSWSSQPAPLPAKPYYDDATLIPLKALFMDRLQHAIPRMERHLLNIAVCVVSVYYQFSETMTPEHKKQAEQHLVNRLVRSVRKGDTVACLQEDLYALILEEIKEPSVVPLILQKIVSAVGAPIHLGGVHVEIKLVVGVSLYPQDGSEPLVLLNKAMNGLRTARLQSHPPAAPPSN
jgi:DNA-binding SARP family transcriptional activator/GGDEF domain-containing protein